MGRLSNRTNGDKARTILKIAFAVLCALAVAAALVVLVITFIRVDYLPLRVQIPVLLLCAAGGLADFLIARQYINAVLDEIE